MESLFYIHVPLSTEFKYPHRSAMGVYLLVLNGISENPKGI